MQTYYHFTIPSPVNELDPGVDAHAIDCWHHKIEGQWYVQYRYDDQTFYETSVVGHDNAMSVVAFMLRAALEDAPFDLDPDALANYFKDNVRV